MNSHEYADAMQAVADLLRSKPVFEMPSYETAFDHKIMFFHDKERFLAAAKAIGGKKSVDDNEFRISHPLTESGAILHLTVYRNVVCTLIEPAKPAVYECEPLLSQAEEAEL